MIMTPDFVTETMFNGGVIKILGKRDDCQSSLRFEPYEEWLIFQTFHIGNYDDEGPILKRLSEEEIPNLGATFNGVHYEVNLSVPRKTEPAKLKTLLCQPIRQNKL